MRIRGELFQRRHRIGLEGEAVNRGDLPGNAIVPPKVGPVGDRLVVHLNEPIVKGLRRQGLPRRHSVVDEDGLLRGHLDADRGAGKDHPDARRPGDFRLRNVAKRCDGGTAGSVDHVGVDPQRRRGGDGFDGFAVADVEDDAAQVARTGQFRRSLDASDDQAFGADLDRLYAFHLRGRSREAFSKLAWIEIGGQLHKVTDPIKRNKHDVVACDPSFSRGALEPIPITNARGSARAAARGSLQYLG